MSAPSSSRIASLDGQLAGEVFWSVALAAVIYFFALVFMRPTFIKANPDFSCFYRAGRMVATGHGAQVYDLSAQRRFDAMLRPDITTAGHRMFTMPFVFAPSSLVIFAPLSLLPYRAADLIWSALNIFLLIATSLFFSHQLHLSRAATCLTVICPALAWPAIFALIHGQVSVLMSALLAVAFSRLLSGLDFQAGCWLAMAALKPQFIAVAVIAMIAARNWAAIRGFLSVSAALAIASCGLIGWRAVINYPKTILSYAALPANAAGTLGKEVPAVMPNLRGLLYHIVGSQRVRTFALLAGTMLCLVMLWIAARTADKIAAFTVSLLVMQLVSFHGGFYDLVLLLPLGPVFAARRRKSSLLVFASLLFVPLLGTIERMALGYCILLLVLLLLEMLLISESKGAHRETHVQVPPAAGDAGSTSGRCFLTKAHREFTIWQV